MKTLDDLSSVSTFGFRGEALSSLCAMSHFTVITNARSENGVSSIGTFLEYDRMGKLTQSKPAARGNHRARK